MGTNSSIGVQPVPVQAPAPGIFLSYRRGDPSARVGRLYDRLVSRFGKERVFRDIDAVLPAANFELMIEHALAASGVLVAVIGPTWQTVTNARGERRLDDSKDYVRYEIARALEDPDCEVLPILRGATTMMPAAEDLPEELRSLVTIQAIRVDDDDEGPHFEFDAQQVVTAVARILGEPDSRVGPDIVLTPPDLVLEPGQSGQIAIAARNIETRPADLAIDYDGPDWARLDPGVESHAGGRERRSSLVVDPPRKSDLPPRAWPYSIQLRDQHAGQPVAQASGTLTTVAFRDTRVKLEPTRLDARRSSTLALTVANHGNVHAYGRVTASAAGFSLAGPDRITVQPGAEETYSVSVGAPRRRLFGRPVESSVAVSVAVEGEPDAHIRKAILRRRPLLPTRAIVLVAAVLVMLLGFGGWRALEAQAKRFPDVIGLAQADALALLTEAGFEPDSIDTRAQEVDQAEVVVRTDPEPGTEISTDEPIQLFLGAESSLVEVPDVAGRPEAEAVAMLEEAGFTHLVSKDQVAAAGQEAGTVVETDPAARSEVPTDEEIVIVVAKADPAADDDADSEGDDGSESETLYTITDVRGLTWTEAVDALPGPLRIFDIYEPSDEVDEGRVIRTEPEIGTSHAADTRVDVVISSGTETTSTTVEMPSVGGETVESATATLTDLGLTPSVVPEETCEIPPGSVTGQSPDPGTKVESGSSVEIVVAQPLPDGCP